MMANAGGAWDNAKKYIEGGAHGGKRYRGPQGRGRRRHGRRPLQGHLRAVAQHPDQADVRGGPGAGALVRPAGEAGSRGPTAGRSRRRLKSVVSRQVEINALRLTSTHFDSLRLASTPQQELPRLARIFACTSGSVPCNATPAAREWPPPPKRWANSATFTSPTDRSDTFTLPWDISRNSSASLTPAIERGCSTIPSRSSGVSP